MSTHLPLCRHVAIASRDSEQEPVVGGEGLRVFENRNVARLGGSVHHAQDVVGKGLGDLVQVDLAAGLLDACLFGLCEFLYVSIHGILREPQALVYCCGCSEQTEPGDGLSCLAIVVRSYVQTR